VTSAVQISITCGIMTSHYTAPPIVPTCSWFCWRANALKSIMYSPYFTQNQHSVNINAAIHTMAQERHKAQTTYSSCQRAMQLMLLSPTQQDIHTT
jgi:hypothetical protein